MTVSTVRAGSARLRILRVQNDLLNLARERPELYARLVEIEARLNEARELLEPRAAQ